MTKCGKGCTPECEYFVTCGCISPFNCLYKVEETYSNSATSNTACYAGTSYTEAQPDESEAGIRKWYRKSVGHEPANYDAAALKAYIAHLEAENAELQEKDIKCADSVDEMIAMCDKCGLHECCGCEHSYSAVQGVKELKEAKHRAEVAERALESACQDIISTIEFICEAGGVVTVENYSPEKATPQAYLKRAERELAEERKDEQS